MSCAIPGPLNQGCGSLLIDPGTLCRASSVPPNNLGLTPLAFDQSFVSEARRQMFRATVREALRLGADEPEMSHLVTKYVFWLERITQEPCDTFGGMVRELEAEWARLVLAEETGTFGETINSEFARLSRQNGVVDSGQLKDLIDYRYRVRPLYFSHGYLDPASFLERVRKYSFLGKYDIFIHEELIEKLEGLAPALNRWAPDLSRRVASEIHGVMGIQIRTIAGSSSLSNHAFGFAIDIDAYSDPHIVGKEVIAALNWVVAQAHVRYDFGKEALSKQERGHSGYTVDDVMEVHNRAGNASRAVQSWLKANLPHYKTLIGQIQDAEKSLGIPKVKSNTPLAERLRRASEVGNKAARKLDKTSPDKVCADLPPNSPERMAEAKIKTLIEQINGDQNLQRIQVLYEHYEDTRYIDTWEKQGIQTIPVYLAAALVGVLDLTWGQTYETSKDAMHFELIGEKQYHRIPPDLPLKKGEKPKTLKRFIEQAFFDETQRLTLTRPALLQSKHARR